jgi:hypothetical protein
MASTWRRGGAAVSRRAFLKFSFIIGAFSDQGSCGWTGQQLLELPTAHRCGSAQDPVSLAMRGWRRKENNKALPLSRPMSGTFPPFR